jgi:4-alpha-glucanotransferase
MQFSELDRYKTGVLVPVFSLKTKKSLGTGEFLDLIEMGKWCADAGLDLIQLLPVNDTGSDPSPYSALSAYALHPLFVRISELPEYKDLAGKRDDIDKAIKTLKKLEKNPRLLYHEVLEQKLAILHRIFQAEREAIQGDAAFGKWMKNNAWVKEYAVFRSIKQQNEYRSWQEWPEHRDISPDAISRLWSAGHYEEYNHFYAWLQFRLEQQFVKAAKALEKMGITLKGDIPILMNEDSADVWAHRDIFHLELRAGAPPDMFAELGQNWGFPIYNWERLKERDYDWWKLRLQQAEKFYEAYRIDHVLGFFRIWSVPQRQKEGILGYFNPSQLIHRHELHGMGFDDGRITWLAEPHLRGHQIHNAFGSAAIEVIARCFRKLGNEDLYLFRDEIDGERAILEQPFEDRIKNQLLQLYRDRAFIAVEDDVFAASWTYRNCSRYQDLSDQEKHLLEELVSRKGWESEQLWERHGEELLTFMRNTVPMLTCAEDLGVVPDCVPRVLERLGILGLKIPRWARRWGQPGDPYIPHVDYPFLSVCAPSVHDTSTLREWWEYEDGREDFWASLGIPGACPPDYSAGTARTVIRRLLDAGSAIAVFQIQDFFALDDNYRVEDSRSERVNIPGTVQERNWSYRIPMTLEDLKKNNDFSSLIAELSEERRRKSP